MGRYLLLMLIVISVVMFFPVSARWYSLIHPSAMGKCLFLLLMSGASLWTIRSVLLKGRSPLQISLGERMWIEFGILYAVFMWIMLIGDSDGSRIPFVAVPLSLLLVVLVSVAYGFRSALYLLRGLLKWLAISNDSKNEEVYSFSGIIGALVCAFCGILIVFNSTVTQ